MTVYLCAAFGRQAEMRLHRARLAESGIAVRARWLNAPPEPPAEEWQQGSAAQMCLDDIAAVDALLAFTESPNGATYFTGGRHVEVGYALALGRKVYRIGPVENVFHCLPEVGCLPDLDTFIRQWSSLRSAGGER